ncbi:MAG TPA: fibronectin type III-like domain-contianing protein, partial [Terrimicrobiaceae bacterium]
KIALAPGEEKVVKFKLSKRDFAYYDTGLHDWNVRSGKFSVLVGGSSRDLPLEAKIEVQATTPTVYPKLTRNSMLKDFQNHPKGNAFYPQLLEASGMDIPSESDAPSPEETAEKRKLRMFVLAFLDEMLVRKLPAFSQGKFTDQQLDEILQQVQ